MSISIGSSISAYSASSSLRPQRPDAATVAGDIFSKLDTKGQGYLQLSDFKNAFASIGSDSTSSSSSSSVEEVFAQIDADSNGKVTQDELASKLQELADTLDSQFNQSRVAGGMPPPPPPPSGEDQGLTEDEMTAMASDATSSDTNLASLLSTVVSNFDAADTDGDGRVTFKEAQAYAQKNESSSSTSESSTSTATSTSNTASADTSSAVMRRILDLVRAYGLGEEGSTSNSSAISVSA